MPEMTLTDLEIPAGASGAGTRSMQRDGSPAER